MRTINNTFIKKKQNGIALLVLVIAIALTLSAYYFSSISIVEIKVDNIEKTRAALKKAKRALIAYAINYPENNPPRGPGYLLCPDTNNDGVAENACNGPITIGRLPWKTLNTGDLRDGANERLWYAVSENFDYTNSPDPPGPSIKTINTSTRGNITVRNNNKNILYDGTTIDGAVAVIISPGLALTRDDGVKQDRSNKISAINYLDVDTSIPEDNVNFVQGVLGGANMDGFIQGGIYDVDNNIIVNDVIEVISYNEIMEQVHKRVSQEISNLINDYFNACDAYPEASAFDPTKVTFNSEGLSPELRRGHLPINSALPIDWESNCTVDSVTMVAPTLPPWLAAEGWHKTSYYAFSYENALHPGAPAADGSTCGNGGNPVCMAVINTTPLINNVQALIIFAGRDTTVGNRPSNVIADYFEGENSDLDGDYDADEIEDYIRVITP